MTFRVPLAMLAAVVSCAFITPASATVIGSLDVTNCAGGSISLSSTGITWLPGGTQPGTGCVDTGAGTNLTYSGGTIGPGVAGDIVNLTFGGGAIDPFITLPAIGPELDFVLTGIGPGSANTICTGLGIGQSCSTLVGSPFVLTSLGTSTLVSFAAYGTVQDGDVTSSWAGAFSTQLNMSAAAIQDTLNGGGSIASTYSGQFQTTPEPSTLSLLMAGAALLAAGLARRKA